MSEHDEYLPITCYQNTTYIPTKRLSQYIPLLTLNEVDITNKNTIPNKNSIYNKYNKYNKNGIKLKQE